MSRNPLLNIALAGTFLLGTIAAQGAQAHHRDWHQGGQSDTSGSSAVEDTDVALALTSAQRTFLSSLLNGSSDQNYLLTEETRADIQSQIDSLPPGIQQRLARGRTLPPGIARKVTLPQQVDQEMGLDENLEITVLGNDVALVDPVTNLVIDLIRDIL